MRTSDTALRIGLPAVLFGLVDAVAVASGGRSLPLSLASGVLLGGFVAGGVVLRDRFRARRRAVGEEHRQTSSAPLGSWSNPSRRQRVITRFWERRHDQGQPPANPLGERRNRH